MDYSLWGCQELDTTKQLSLNRPEVSQMVQNIKQYQARKFFLKFLNYPIHRIYSTDMKFTYCLSRLDNFLIVSVCPCKCLCFAHALSRCSWGTEICICNIWKKAMTNIDSILKSRDITLLTKAHIVKAMFFPVVIHRCESWTIKKAEH